MVLRSEIRQLNGRWRYCWIDYADPSNPKIVRWTRYVNSDIIFPQEEKQIEIKPVETKPEESEVETEVETKDEIKDEEINNTDEVTDMVEATEIKRQIMDEMENKSRTEKLENELGQTKSYVKSLESTLGNINEKLDAMMKQKSKDTTQSIIDQQRMAAEHNHKESDLKCPNGNCGHQLKKVDDHTVKCTGASCGKEFRMLEKKDAFCTSCGLPINKEEVQKMDACPGCGGKHVMPYGDKI